LPAANVIVQPENRGNAHGVLLSLLHIIECDPGAQLVLLPSDHHVRQEAILARALRQAVEQLRWRFDETVLLGFEPEEADPELGYILPGRSDGRGALEVAQFVEKPAIAQTHELIGRGGLWNGFIMASTAQALLGLFQRRVPGIVKEMRAAVQRDRASPMPESAIAKLYDRLPTMDFSRDILQGQEAQLRVLPVASCGDSPFNRTACRAGRGFRSDLVRGRLSRARQLGARVRYRRTGVHCELDRMAGAAGETRPRAGASAARP
jgi:mannose-1-phosphate guanylyltransferase